MHSSCFRHHVINDGWAAASGTVSTRRGAQQRAAAAAAGCSHCSEGTCPAVSRGGVKQALAKVALTSLRARENRFMKWNAAACFLYTVKSKKLEKSWFY